MHMKMCPQCGLQCYGLVLTSCGTMLWHSLMQGLAADQMLQATCIWLACSLHVCSLDYSSTSPDCSACSAGPPK